MKRIVILWLFVVAFLNATSVTDFIELDRCDKVMDKKYFNICYKNKFKGPIAGWATLDGSKVFEKNIKKRPRFYSDDEVDPRYRANYRDYTGYGRLTNRGHIIISDADLDYSKESLKSCFVMSNIVPEYAKLNQKTWLKVEKYGRKIASKLGYVNSVTLINYKHFGADTVRNRVAIPEEFYRVYYNNEANFEKCFYYKNERVLNWRKDKLKDHIVSCEDVKMKEL